MITLINPTLPYGFAKRHGVILLDAGEIAVVGLREGADPSALIETRRALGRPLRVEALDQATFDRRLSQVYAGDHLSATDGDELVVPAGPECLNDVLRAPGHLPVTRHDVPVSPVPTGFPV